MRSLLVTLLALTLGCQSHRGEIPSGFTEQAIVVALDRPAYDTVPVDSGNSTPGLSGPVDLPSLWNLALANSPELREAAADEEAARGRWIQAGKYPNPRLGFQQNTIGSRVARQGNSSIEWTQEIVTAGKRQLDQAVATRETDSTAVALLARKFSVLTEVRRAYYEYLGWQDTLRINDEILTTLRQGIEMTRQLVEKAKIRPHTDLLALEALLEEAKINLEQNRVKRESVWRQLAATVGIPELSLPGVPSDPAVPVPDWQSPAVVQRVLAAHTSLKLAAVEAERARLALARAKAEAVPNITVGGGYVAENVDNTAGGIISIEAPLPLWNRNQGRIHEAEAQWARAQATMRSTAMRLHRETAAAFARFQTARIEVERLSTEVLPRLKERLDLLGKNYQAGGGQVTFSDLLMTEQALNTTRLTLAEARRTLWQAIAELQGLMQLDIDETIEASP